MDQGRLWRFHGHDQRDWELQHNTAYQSDLSSDLTTMIQTTTLVNKHGARKRESQSILDGLTISLLSKPSKQSPTQSKISVSDE